MNDTSININSSAVVRHTARLEKLHRSALPVAVRQTLSKAAFDVKMRTMPAQANKNFEKREPNFFKANSKVTPAKGFDMRTMVATVGFVPLKGTNKAVDDLKQQEDGGNIGGRSFIVVKQARNSGLWRRKIRKSTPRISDVKGKVIDANKMKGKNAREKWKKAAHRAGIGGFVMGTRKFKGGRVVFRINNINRYDVNGRDYTFTAQDPLFIVKRGREVKPPATHFMRTASLQSAKGMESIFIQEANKQIAKYR